MIPGLTAGYVYQAEAQGLLSCLVLPTYLTHVFHAVSLHPSDVFLPGPSLISANQRDLEGLGSPYSSGDRAVPHGSHTSSQASSVVVPPAVLTRGGWVVVVVVLYEIARVVGEVVPAGPEVTLLPYLNTNEEKSQGPQPKWLLLCS